MKPLENGLHLDNENQYLVKNKNGLGFRDSIHGPCGRCDELYDEDLEIDKLYSFKNGEPLQLNLCHRCWVKIDLD